MQQSSGSSSKLEEKEEILDCDFDIEDDTKVTFKTYFEKFLGSTALGVVIGNRELAVDWEVWTLKKIDSKLAIQSFHGLFLTSNALDAVSTTSELTPFCKWEIVKDGKKRYLRNAETKLYLCVEPNGVVCCDRKKPKKWERFVIGQVNSNKTRMGALTSYHGKYLTTEKEGSLIANKTQVTNSEVFTFEKIGTYWAIRSPEGRYIGADEDGLVFAMKREITNNEKWIKTKQGKHRSYYQSYFGKYLCAEPNGVIVANREKPKKWELWQHEWLK